MRIDSAEESIRIKELPRSEGGSAWILSKLSNTGGTREEEVAADKAEVFYGVAQALGFEEVSLSKCCEVFGIGRREAVRATQEKRRGEFRSEEDEN